MLLSSNSHKASACSVLVPCAAPRPLLGSGLFRIEVRLGGDASFLRNSFAFGVTIKGGVRVERSKIDSCTFGSVFVVWVPLSTFCEAGSPFLSISRRSSERSAFRRRISSLSLLFSSTKARFLSKIPTRSGAVGTVTLVLEYIPLTSMAPNEPTWSRLLAELAFIRSN